MVYHNYKLYYTHIPVSETQTYTEKLYLVHIHINGAQYKENIHIYIYLTSYISHTHTIKYKYEKRATVDQKKGRDLKRRTYLPPGRAEMSFAPLIRKHICRNVWIISAAPSNFNNNRLCFFVPGSLFSLM